MPEEATPTTPAESSPAPAPAPLDVPRDADQYAHWRMTGELPDKPPASEPKEKEESATSTEATGAEPEKKSQQQEQRRRSNADERLHELLNDLKTAGLTPKELKTFRRQQAEREAPQPAARAAPETTEQPAAAAPAGPPVRPKQEDYPTWDEYEEARDKYHEAMADYKVARALAAERERVQAEARQREANEKLEDAGKRYGAEAKEAIRKTAQAFAGDRQIHPAVKALLDDSPVLTDLLFVMGDRPDDLQELLTEARQRPGQAIRRIVLLEKLVSEELAGKGSSPAAPARDEDGKFLPGAAKKTTAAPPPPKEVTGRGSPPPDEAERAVVTGDQTTFNATRNRRDIAARRGL